MNPPPRFHDLPEDILSRVLFFLAGNSSDVGGDDSSADDGSAMGGGGDSSADDESAMSDSSSSPPSLQSDDSSDNGDDDDGSQDVFSFLSSSRTLSLEPGCIGRNRRVWRILVRIASGGEVDEKKGFQEDDDDDEGSATMEVDDDEEEENLPPSTSDGDSHILFLKRRFVRACRLSSLSRVRWTPTTVAAAPALVNDDAVDDTERRWPDSLFQAIADRSHAQDMAEDSNVPSAREGHNMCVLDSFDGTGAKHVVLTGGFTSDSSVRVLKVPSDGQWRSITSTYTRYGASSFVYGASLTPITSVATPDGRRKHRLVRFGGFESGGYSGETNEVTLLTLDLDDDGVAATAAAGDNREEEAFWERVVVSTPSNREQKTLGGRDEDDFDYGYDSENDGMNGASVARPRAYHSATLLSDRYLVIVGGMMSEGSVTDVDVLDTELWRWLDPPCGIAASSTTAAPVDDIDSACAAAVAAARSAATHDYDYVDDGSIEPDEIRPSGRHGHSTILDERRNRLVVFGGGNGFDLLRSGVDNAEVWELKLGNHWKDDLEGSFPWKWNLVHADNIHDDKDEHFYNHHVHPKKLTRRERTNLGRCHNCVKVSPTTAIFFGGGGRSTDSVLAFDLRSDSFIRPDVSGAVPRPRFTAASAVVDWEDGAGGGSRYLLVHGGFYGQALGDFVALDLAPRRRNRRAEGRNDEDDGGALEVPARDFPATFRSRGRRVPMQLRGHAPLHGFLEAFMGGDGYRDGL